MRRIHNSECLCRFTLDGSIHHLPPHWLPPPERQYGALGSRPPLLPSRHVHGPTEAHPEALWQIAGLLQPPGALLVFFILVLVIHHRFLSLIGVGGPARSRQEGLRSHQCLAGGGVAEVQHGRLHHPDQLYGIPGGPAQRADGQNTALFPVHKAAAGEGPTLKFKGATWKIGPGF